MGIKEQLTFIFLLVLLILGGYFLYDGYFHKKIIDLNSPEQDEKIQKELEETSREIKQFYENMRFNHNKITYYINPLCSKDKRNRMIRAFNIIMDETRLITFSEANEDNADLLVGCTKDAYEKEKNIFVGGEGGPTRIITNSSYSIITKAKVLLYNESQADCEKPILELHELLHALGYDHISDQTDIMYPYLKCNQELKQGHIEHLKTLYSVVPFADLSFIDLKAYRHQYEGRWYLDFNSTIANRGMIDAEKDKLIIYEDEVSIQKFDLETIHFGTEKTFSVTNVLLSSEKTEIEFELTTESYEPNKKNNRRTLSNT